MILELPLHVYIMSGFWGVVDTKPVIVSIYANGCSVFFAVLRYAKEASFIIFIAIAFILAIMSIIYQPKIINPIVGFVIIFMVYLASRPFSINIKPSDTVKKVKPRVYFCLKIPVTVFSAYYVAYFSALGGFFNSGENSSFRAVIEKRLDKFLSNHLIFLTNKFKFVGNLMSKALESLAKPVPTINYNMVL